MMGQEKSRFPAAFLAGVAVLLALLGGFWLLTRHSRSSQPAPERRLPMRPAEQAYAPRIHFVEAQMSRAANLLNQEITIIPGAVVNEGPRTIREMEVTLEFRDIFNQVVLREERRLFGPRSAALAPGERREFQFNFEHIPADWNRRFPTFRVTGLLLE